MFSCWDGCMVSWQPDRLSQFYKVMNTFDRARFGNNYW